MIVCGLLCAGGAGGDGNEEAGGEAGKETNGFHGFPSSAACISMRAAYVCIYVAAERRTQARAGEFFEEA